MNYKVRIAVWAVCFIIIGYAADPTTTRVFLAAVFWILVWQQKRLADIAKIAMHLDYKLADQDTSMVRKHIFGVPSPVVKRSVTPEQTGVPKQPRVFGSEERPNTGEYRYGIYKGGLGAKDEQ